jgi:Flp pilus assembly protein TadB
MVGWPGSASRRDCWTVSMLEVAAALCAGLGVTAAIVTVAIPAPAALDEGVIPSWLRRFLSNRWKDENALVVGAGWRINGAVGLAVVQAAVAAAVGCCAALITGLPALGAAGAIAGVALVRGSVAARKRSRQVIRQDAVLDAVRMLRHLLETGASSVHAAVAVLGERGPAPLRLEFRVIAGTSVGRRQAWNAARHRIGEPLFDMLAAAVLIQGPVGGELAPLFADLEASVSGAQEVEREARALQVQARSAAAIIVSLPIVFLVVLSTLRSPYLDAYHNPTGQAFLLAMLAVMACSYVWMRRLLLLPGLQRVRLRDA